MIAADLDAALAEAREAILAAPDPGGAAARLQRWTRRERAFSSTSAALAIDDIVAAKTSGVSLGAVADRRRVHVHD